MIKIHQNIFFVGVALMLGTTCMAQKIKPQQKLITPARQTNLSDSALLDMVQKQTFKYFWEFAHPVSGMAR